MKALFITHDCCLAGAQHSFLRILDWAVAHTGWDIRVLALGDGPLAEAYASRAPFLLLPYPDENAGAPDSTARAEAWYAALHDFMDGAPDVVWGNTVVSARCYPQVSRFGCPVVTRVAELGTSIAAYATPRTMENLIRYSAGCIAVSSPVADMLKQQYGVPDARIAVINGAISATQTTLDAARRAQVCATYGIRPDVPLLWGCGSISRRKGADLFLSVAEALVVAGYYDFHAIWCGHPEDDLVRSLFLRKEQSPARGFVSFAGSTHRPELLMQPGDVFLMTSREDPFPLVCLEAAERAVPSLCFAGSGGIVEFVAAGGGHVAASMQPESMAADALELLRNPQLVRECGAIARKLVLQRHTMATAGPQFASFLLSFCGV